jgi:hypothetical protein
MPRSHRPDALRPPAAPSPVPRPPSPPPLQSFSFTVNFNAVRLFTLAHGGFSLNTSYLAGFKVCAFVTDAPLVDTPIRGDALAAAAATILPPAALERYPRLCHAWADVMDTFGPDTFVALQRAAKDEVPDPSLRTAQAVVRLSNWDPDVFFKFKNTFITRAPAAPPRVQADLYRDVRRVYERYYPLNAARDMAFELGRVCMAVRRYPEAVALFMASARQAGPHHVTAYNIGISLFHMRQFHASIAALDRALVLDPKYGDAAAWRARAVEEATRAAGGAGGAAAGGAGGAAAAEDGGGDGGGGGGRGGGGGTDGADTAAVPTAVAAAPPPGAPPPPGIARR